MDFFKSTLFSEHFLVFQKGMVKEETATVSWVDEEHQTPGATCTMPA